MSDAGGTGRSRSPRPTGGSRANLQREPQRADLRTQGRGPQFRASPARRRDPGGGMAEGDATGMKLTGEMGAFRRDPLGMLERCAQEQGDLARIRFGLNRAMILSHPGLVEEVLVTRNQSFRKNPATRRLGTLLGRGLVSADGDAWRRQRRVTQPAFHRARVNAMGGAIVDYAQRQLAVWQSGEMRDVHKEMMELTLQIACKTLFGAEVAADLQVVREATTAVGQ